MWIDRFGLKNVWTAAVDREDARILKIQWIVNQLWILALTTEFAFVMSRSCDLNESWIMDLSSVLVGTLMSSSKLFLL